MQSKTWKQELAEAITPLEGLDDVKATIIYNVTVISGDPFGPTAGSTGTVQISRTVQVKGVSAVDKRLVDGKNYTSSDFTTEISFLACLKMRQPKQSDPPILNNGVVKTLEEMRPMEENYGFALGQDLLQVGPDTWAICDVIADGLLNNDQGIATPAKLQLVLRKGSL